MHEEIDFVLQFRDIRLCFGYSPVNPVFEEIQPLIECIAAKEIFTEDVRSPNAKLRSSYRFDAISNGNDYVQAIHLDWLIGERNVQKMHIAFLVQLTL